MCVYLKVRASSYNCLLSLQKNRNIHHNCMIKSTTLLAACEQQIGFDNAPIAQDVFSHCTGRISANASTHVLDHPMKTGGEFIRVTIKCNAYVYNYFTSFMTLGWNRACLPVPVLLGFLASPLSTIPTCWPGCFTDSSTTRLSEGIEAMCVRWSHQKSYSRKL